MKRRDDGVALLYAVALLTIVGILMLALSGLALRETRQSGESRQRASAVSLADGTLDAVLAQVQSSAVGSLPCGQLAQVAQKVGSDTLTPTALIKYFKSTDSASLLDCSLVNAPTSAADVAMYAVISTSVTSNAIPGAVAAQRKMEMRLALTPIYGNTLANAVFGRAAVTSDNQAHVNQTPGSVNNANVYTDGPFTCDGQQSFQGSVTAPTGDVSLSGSCSVGGLIWTGKTFHAANPSTASSDVRATVAADMKGGSVSGVVKSPSITASWCSSNVGHCNTTGTVPAPTSQPWPVFNWNGSTTSSDLIKLGYTTSTGALNLVSGPTDCSVPSGSKSNAAGDWIWQNAPSLSRPTVMYTPCRVVLRNSPSGAPDCPTVKNALCIANNLVIVAAQGIQVSQSVNFVSSIAGTVRNLYLMQPADGSPNCSAAGINLDNTVSFSSDVHSFLYSPCDVIKANQGSFYGQVYSGGTAQLANLTQLTFYQLPVFGLSNAQFALSAYKADINYRRELLN